MDKGTREGIMTDNSNNDSIIINKGTVTTDMAIALGEGRICGATTTVQTDMVPRGGQRANNRPVICFTCGGTGHVSAQCPSFRGNNGSANAHMMEHGDNTRQSNHNYSVQDLTDDLSYSFCFMTSAHSTINFPFGDRQALVSIDSS